MANAAGTVKRVFLELGGKSATIVLDDADFSSALLSGFAVCYHAGQGCAIATRMLLPRSRYAEGVEFLKAAFEQFAYGDPYGEGQIMGPLVSARQQERVLEYIEIGKREGARLVCGGRRPAHLPRGYYVEPTIFADVTNDMRIAQEEIFGPVLVVIPYEDDEDAIRIANDSIYGLSGADLSAATSARHGHCAAHPHRHHERQRRQFLRSRFALWRLQAKRRRARDGRGGAGGVPADQDRRGPGLRRHAEPYLKGQVIAVTGASRGIGLASCTQPRGTRRARGAAGAQPGPLEAAVSALGPEHACAVVADVCSKASIEAAFRAARAALGPAGRAGEQCRLPVRAPAWRSCRKPRCGSCWS